MKNQEMILIMDDVNTKVSLGTILDITNNRREKQQNQTLVIILSGRKFKIMNTILKIPK